MPIRARMALLGVGVIAGTLVLFSVLVYGLAARNVPREQDVELRRRAERAVAFAAEASPEDLQPRRIPAAPDLRESSEVFVVLLDAAGGPIASTGELDGSAPHIPADALATAALSGASVTVELTPGERFRVQIEPWERPDLDLRGYAIAGQSLRYNQTQVGRLLVFLVIAWTISMTAAAAAIWIILGRALRPLKTVAHAADEIARTRDFSCRLPPVRTRDETRLLTDSFNRMLGQLEGALESQRRFIADASHELRTPLTTLRTNAAFLQQPNVPRGERAAALQDIAAESERMSRLAQDLLTLARADADRPLARAPLDLAVIARDVCRRARAFVPGRPIEIIGDETLPVCGNDDALTRLLWILLDNAVKHTPASSPICVELRSADGVAHVSVADAGPGIPPGEEERIYQADAARSDGGAGLGLAIARSIATAHGGAVRARTNAAGGATFLVELPHAGSPEADGLSSAPHS